MCFSHSAGTVLALDQSTCWSTSLLCTGSLNPVAHWPCRHSERVSRARLLHFMQQLRTAYGTLNSCDKIKDQQTPRKSSLRGLRGAELRLGKSTVQVLAGASSPGTAASACLTVKPYSKQSTDMLPGDPRDPEEARNTLKTFIPQS